MNSWLSGVLLSFVVGTAVQLQTPDLLAFSVYGAVLGFALLGVVVLGLLSLRNVPKPRLIGLGLVFLVAALGWSLTGVRAHLKLEQHIQPDLEGQNLRLTGVVAAMPQFHDAGVRFVFEVEQADFQGRPVAVPPKILLGWYGGSWTGPEVLSDLQPTPMAIQAGERWQFTVRLKAPNGNFNPHGFDYELWLWEQGIQATGYVRSGARDPAPRRMEATWLHPVEWARQQVRDAIFKRGQQERGQQDSWGVVAALVVGDQRAIDRAQWEVFRITGVAHLMSISGLHITMLAWLAAALVGVCWRTRSRLCLWIPAPVAAAWVGLAVATAYALFSGWGLPAQRTICMLATWTLLQYLGRRWPWTVQWMLACAVVVAWDPWALMQAGFWLSFVAVGVLFVAGPNQSEQTPSPYRHLKNLWKEQWVVTLALTPLTLLLFGQVSWVGLLANLVAIPWVTLLVTPLSLLGMVVPLSWDAAAWTLQGLLVLLHHMAQWSWAVSFLPQAPWWAGALGLGGGALLVLNLPWCMRLAGVPLLMPLLFWHVPTPAPGQFEVLAADVGQGTAVLVRTSQHALLYDAGPRYSKDSDAGHRILVPLLRSLDVKLNRLVLSHRDADHVGGALAVLKAHPQADLVSSLEDGHELTHLVQSRTSGVNTTERCEAGQQWTWDRVHFEFLHPQAEDYGRSRKPNAVSCVLRISAAPVNGQTRTVLLTGDIERSEEKSLLQSGEPLQSHLLLVPHHGSKTSSSRAFLEAVQPEQALVQAGYRNRYGHPAPHVMQRYQDLGIEVLDSTRCGAYTWRSDAAATCARDTQRRYWHHQLPPLTSLPPMPP